MTEKTYQKGERIFSQNMTCDRIMFVKSGRIKIYRISSSGREQTLETLGPGETCSCNPGSVKWPCSSSAEALTPCILWHLSCDEYVRLVQTNLQLARNLNELFAKRLQCFMNLIEEVSLKDAKKRLVKFLLDMLHAKKAKSHDNEILFIPFTREEIAKRLGTVRETIVRYLSQLKKDKLIEIKPYQVIVLDEEGLKKLL